MDERASTPRVGVALAITTVIVVGGVAGSAAALQPSLSVSATTTVGDEPVTAIAHRAGQTAELHVDYAGFGQGTHDIVIELQTTGTDPIFQSTSITVTGDSGTETVRLDELFDLSDFQTGMTLELTMRAEGLGVDGQREVQDSLAIDLVPATIYLTEVPSVVIVDQEVTVRYYGWGREPLTDGVRLLADREPLGTDEQGEDTLLSSDAIDQTADPFFEGSFAFAPERDLDEVGSSIALQARPSPEAEGVPGSNVVAVSLNRRPDAVIDYSPENPTVGETVTFSAGDSTDPDGHIDEFDWDLDGDGDFESTGTVPTETYESGGTLTVRLRVTDDQGATDVDSVSLFVVTPTTDGPDGWPDLWPEVAAGGGTILILGLGYWFRGPIKQKAERLKDRIKDGSNNPPISVPGFVPRNPQVYQPVLFDGSLSFDPDPEDGIAAYRWTIGGQNHQRSRVVHAFGEAGKKEVSLEVTDMHGATTSSSESVEVESAEGTLELHAVNPEAPGTPHENLDEEYLVFRNTGDAPLDISGWTLHDAAQEAGRARPDEHTFEFDDGLELEPGATVTVHTGSPTEGDDEWEETPEARHLFWGKNTTVWDNHGDHLVIKDEGGHPALAARYERDQAGVYEVATVDDQSLLDWFPSVEVKGTYDTPAGGIGFDIGLGSFTAIRDLVAGAFFLRGPRTFLKAWGIATLAVIGSASIAFAGSSQEFVLPLVLLPVTLVALFVGVVWLVGRWVLGIFRS